MIDLVRKLIKNDLKSRYSGSVFGIVWAFIQPLVTVLVFWYVFQIGFRNPPVEDVEYIVWFVAGYIPWTFFNDGLMSSTNVLYEYSYLVKKMKFKVWLLPVIKVLSALYIHGYFIVFVIGIYLAYGYVFQLSWLSVLYYSFATTILLIGVSYITSSLAVFLKDMSQFIAIFLQIFFWMTPIFWTNSAMNDSVLRVLKLNPMYYIIQGYRSALIDGKFFWEQSSKLTLWFWAVTIFMILAGGFVYKKLKVHFPDLL